MKKEINMTICRDTKALRHKRQRKRRRQRFLTMLFVMMIFLIPTGFFCFKFYQSHFNPGTQINGLDCSWLTPKEAYEKLNSIFQVPEILVKFDTADCYFSSDAIDLIFDDSTEEMLLIQKSAHQQEFAFSSFSFNEEKLKEILRINIQPEQRCYPENAFIILEDELLKIVPEEKGNFLSLEDAYQLVENQLKLGNWSIDLTPIIISEPEVTAADLKENVEEINSILKTSITFTIKKDCNLILDKSVMCKWLVLENGKYFLDLDTNLPKFVETLKEKCDANMPVSISFQGTGDVGRYSIPAYKLPLDTEAELAFIRERICTGESYTHQPIYQLDNQNYVEVDITRQHVWFYKNGVCVIDSDCVTGTANGKRDTSQGYFVLENKVRNKTLKGPGYATPVAYWMPFNGGQGLHDANWRENRFGGNIYLTNGSHGCVNLPPEVAKTIFENIDVLTPVIVYASS